MPKNVRIKRRKTSAVVAPKVAKARASGLALRRARWREIIARTQRGRDAITAVIEGR